MSVTTRTATAAVLAIIALGLANAAEYHTEGVLRMPSGLGFLEVLAQGSYSASADLYYELKDDGYYSP